MPSNDFFFAAEDETCVLQRRFRRRAIRTPLLFRPSGGRSSSDPRVRSPSELSTWHPAAGPRPALDGATRCRHDPAFMAADGFATRTIWVSIAVPLPRRSPPATAPRPPLLRDTGAAPARGADRADDARLLLAGGVLELEEPSSAGALERGVVGTGGVHGCLCCPVDLRPRSERLSRRSSSALVDLRPLRALVPSIFVPAPSACPVDLRPLRALVPLALVGSERSPRVRSRRELVRALGRPAPPPRCRRVRAMPWRQRVLAAGSGGFAIGGSRSRRRSVGARRRRRPVSDATSRPADLSDRGSGIYGVEVCGSGLERARSLWDDHLSRSFGSETFLRRGAYDVSSLTYTNAVVEALKRQIDWLMGRLAGFLFRPTSSSARSHRLKDVLVANENSGRVSAASKREVDATPRSSGTHPRRPTASPRSVFLRMSTS